MTLGRSASGQSSVGRESRLSRERLAPNLYKLESPAMVGIAGAWTPVCPKANEAIVKVRTKDLARFLLLDRPWLDRG